MERQHSKRRLGLRVIFGYLLGLLVLGISAPGEVSHASGAAPTGQDQPDWTRCTNFCKDVLPPGYSQSGPNCLSASYPGSGPSLGVQDIGISVILHIADTAEGARAEAVTTGSGCSPSSEYGDSGTVCEEQPSQIESHGRIEILFARDRVSADVYTTNIVGAGKAREIAAYVSKKLAEAIARNCASSAISLTPTVTAIPAAIDLTVEHIEMVQVVQTQDNKIPLVAGKKTVVRVFVQAKSQTEQLGVKASLFIWPEGKSEVEVQGGTLSVLNPGATPQRDRTDSSINFVIPPDLTAAGVFSLRVVVNPDHSVKERNYDNNTLTEPFEFVQRNGLRVGFVRIGYKPPGQVQWEWPGTNIQNYSGMTRKLFPVADAGIQYYELPWRVRAVRPLNTTDLGDDLNWTLREYYDRMSGDKPDILVGWLPDTYIDTLDFGGLAETVVSGQVARVLLAVDSHNEYAFNHVLPHEVAHDLGLKHPATKGDPDSDCRFAPNDDANYWPKEYNNSATIHELGFDTEKMAVIPSDYYDLMSYCGASKAWISPFHYKKLYDTNLRPQAAFVTNRANFMYVRGWATLKGDAAQIEVVRPPDAVSGDVPAQPWAGGGRYSTSFASHLILPLYGQGRASVLREREGAGNHCLRFLDAGGATLYERCFDLQFKSEETLQPTEKSGFVLDVPNTPNVARVTLVRNEGGQERDLTSLKVSSHAPALAITSPKVGDRWDGEHTITWTGSDEDNGTLRYDILYSSDGKSTWNPQEVGSHETQYTFSTEEILPSDQTYIRILASDGFNTTHSDVGPLVIPKQLNSPGLPPGSASQPRPQPLPGPTAPSGGLNAIWFAIIGGTVLMVVGGFALLFVLMRRSRTQQAVPGMYGMPGTTPPPWNPPPSPHSPALPPHPAIAARFRWAEQEYGRLRGELAAGHLHPQQRQAALAQLRVQDPQGRHWMLAPDTGQWLVYDGRGWVRADPYRQG